MENMILKIENDNYEEKNMLNISHYVDVSPQPLSEKSSTNSISRDQKMLTAQKTKKSRNKRNNINTTSTNDDLSFKTELRNNINLKIKKKMAQNIIPHNNSTSSNLEIKKKSNLVNFEESYIIAYPVSFEGILKFSPFTFKSPNSVSTITT